MRRKTFSHTRTHARTDVETDRQKRKALLINSARSVMFYIICCCSTYSLPYQLLTHLLCPASPGFCFTWTHHCRFRLQLSDSKWLNFGKSGWNKKCSNILSTVNWNIIHPNYLEWRQTYFFKKHIRKKQKNMHVRAYTRTNTKWQEVLFKSQLLTTNSAAAFDGSVEHQDR